METKDFDLRVKTIEDSGEFTAYAAVYGVEDLQGDVIEAGAFKKAIKEQVDGFPLLWSHKTDTPVGLATLEDSPKGPIVRGAIDKDDPDGATAYRRVKNGLVKGISIGFSLPNPDAVKYAAGGTRHIRELRLHELSLVAIPAQPGAQIISVKQLGDAARLLKNFEPAKLSASEFDVLRGIEAELARLLPNDRGAAERKSMLTELKNFATFLEGRGDH